MKEKIMIYSLAKKLMEINPDSEFVENHSNYGIIVKDIGKLITNIIKNADEFCGLSDPIFSFYDYIDNLHVIKQENDYLIY